MCFNDDGFRNMFVYQLVLNTSELKEYKGIDCVLSWKSKGVYTSKLKALYTAFLNSINLSGYRIRLQFDNGILAIEQNNIENAYIVYDLDDWPKLKN